MLWVKLLFHSSKLIQSVQFPAPHCEGSNCTEVALVFAFSFGATDQRCRQSSLFGIFNFTYALQSMNNKTYTMTWCNGTTCPKDRSKCPSLFTALPLNVCRDNSWGSMIGNIELVETGKLLTCSSQHTLVSYSLLIGTSPLF